MAATKKSEQERPDPNTWRLAELHIQNYKSLDDVHLSFPMPSTVDALDAFVLGSQNGVGKTSLLECCALAMIADSYPDLLGLDARMRDEPTVYDLLIRSGAKQSVITAHVGNAATRTLKLNHVGFHVDEKQPSRRVNLGPEQYASLEDGEFLNSLLGMNSEPLVLPSVLLFHSYRKVVEGSSALGAMVDPAFVRRRFPPRRYGGPGPLSTFKVVLVQALMAKSGLFEGIHTRRDNEQVLEKLNGLIKQFAGGSVDKLRPGPDGTLELRVAPSAGGASFSFDGLSSGQKEIIATLFLIWFMTQDRPALVLIDEPELHLNAEWQRVFVHQLAALAPNNQYILATHSDEIFASVAEGRRLMLQRG
jgi:predicted ATPase